MKAEKEAERQKKAETASMLQGYRGGVKEEELKLKKEKDADRQKKLESASMLQGYRGGVKEEDLKLKALREEERKRHEDAKRTLHSYQAKEVKTIPKERKSMGPQTTAYPTPVNSGTDKNNNPLAGIEFGNVSERAAALAAAAESVSETGAGGSNYNNTGSTNGVPGSAESPVTTQDAAVISDSPVLVEAPSAESGSSADGPNPAAPTGESPVMVSPAVVEKEPQVETSPVTNNVHAAVPAAAVESSSVRFDVLFSFGLVTVHQDPNLTSYMAAVQNVVSTALTDKTDSNITFDPSHGPFVKNKKWDPKYVSRSGRADVKRMEVTAAVPIFAKNSSMRSEAKKSVVGALQAAIQSGDFLSLAQK